VVVYVVAAPGPIVLGVYIRKEHAQSHMRCVVGAIVVTTDIRTMLPEEVLDQLGEDFEDYNMPVTTPLKKPPRGSS
jgi:hypothetical protein